MTSANRNRDAFFFLLLSEIYRCYSFFLWNNKKKKVIIISNFFVLQNHKSKE